MKIGFMAGAFDLFHVGHLNILRAARALCDKLIVGVSSDELILSYKGKRPVIPLAERMAIVRSIRFTDVALTLTKRDRWADWMRLKFDVLFVGDDWFGAPEWEAWEARLKPVGVKVVYLSRTIGISTSGIIERIRSNDEL